LLDEGRTSIEPIEYAAFRTGITFADVRRMLWVGSDDPSDWRYKRRHTVLGHWRAIKQQMYAEYLERLRPDHERRHRAKPPRAKVRPARPVTKLARKSRAVSKVPL
jgi:hypothetical protein